MDPFLAEFLFSDDAAPHGGPVPESDLTRDRTSIPANGRERDLGLANGGESDQLTADFLSWGSTLLNEPEFSGFDFIGGASGWPEAEGEAALSGIGHPAPAQTIDDFFRSNGGYRPLAPCDHCRSLRLQCFVLQTTSANPNPVECCSSCAALFRDCSLAEQGKRQASVFETNQPVIGQLHGIGEEYGPTSRETPGSQAEASAPSSKRTSSRSVHKTRPLRNWLACHLDNPYPTEEEKLALAKESGLVKSQVVNWFTNARRRQRQSTRAASSSNIVPKGSPMPSPLCSMSPMERWRHSPPEDDPVSPSDIQRALDAGDNSVPERLYVSDQERCPSGSSRESSSSIPFYSNYPDSQSTSSCVSYIAGDDSTLSWSHHGSEDGGSSLAAAAPGPQRPMPASHPCMFCGRSFRKRHDRLRHERSVHMPKLDRWICGVPLPPNQPFVIWRLERDAPECIFCGEASPTQEHFESHEFASCLERTVEDRTFTRKDHLWQHLYKFHGCRKWDGWKPTLEPLRHIEGDAL